MNDEEKARREVMIDIMGHRDVLLQCAQRFLNTVTVEDYESLEPLQQAYIQDLAMHAGCTNLPWWGLPLSELEEK